MLANYSQLEMPLFTVSTAGTPHRSSQTVSPSLQTSFSDTTLSVRLSSARGERRTRRRSRAPTSPSSTAASTSSRGTATATLFSRPALKTTAAAAATAVVVVMVVVAVRSRGDRSRGGGKGDGAGQFQTAHGVFAHDGHIFVANREAHQVLEFTPEGTTLLAFGAS